MAKKSTSKSSGLVKNNSAYLFFCKEERATVVNECPDLKSKEVLTELGKRWKLLTTSENSKDKVRLEKLKKLAEDDKVRYDQDKLKLSSQQEETKDEQPEPVKPEPVKSSKKQSMSVEPPQTPPPAPVEQQNVKTTKVNGYIVYSKRHRAEVKERLGDVPATEVTKELGRLWKALSPEEQEPYKQ